MTQFTLDPMPTTTMGENAVTGLSQQIRVHGKRAFIVTDRGIEAAGILATVTGALDDDGIEWAGFTGVDPNPNDANVAEGIAAINDFGIADTVVVLLGGGSAMDCGKYIALAAPSGVDDLRLAFSPELDDNDKIDFSTLAPAKPTAAGLPTVAVPTTSGTASETNGGGLITRSRDHRKLTFSNPDVQPRAVILDPVLTVGLPPRATAACGMDVLTHAIEAYTSLASNPYADGLALHAIGLVGRSLARAVDDGSDIEARATMQIASHLAGRAFSSGPLLGLVHATGHPVSGTFGIAHGQTLATMLPHVMRFNFEAVEDRYAEVGAALGTERDGAKAIDAVQTLSAQVGTNRTLTELGATADDVEALTEDALSDLIILNTPRYPTRSEVKDLYLQAL